MNKKIEGDCFPVDVSPGSGKSDFAPLLNGKKIAIVFPKDSESLFNGRSKTFGGASVQLHKVARALCASHEVYPLLSSLEGLKSEAAEGLHVMFTFNNEDSMFAKVLKFHRVLCSIKPDVLMQRGLTLLSCLLAPYCRIRGIRFIFMFAHDREARGRYQRTNNRNILFPLLLRFANALVVQNDYQYFRMPEHVRHKVCKVRSICEILEYTRQAHEKAGCLWVGRLEPWKGPESFIKIAEAFPDETFTMVAPRVPGYGRYAKKVRAMAEAARNIRFVDFVDYNGMEEYFLKAKIYINTSLEEGFPNTFLESCRCRTPIVSMHVNPDRCLCNHGAGVWCGGSVEKMIQSVGRLLTDEPFYEECSRSAFGYVQAFHGVKDNMGLLETVLQG